MKTILTSSLVSAVLLLCCAARAEGTAPAPRLERRDPTMWGGGLVLTIAGGIAIPAGLAMSVRGSNACYMSCGEPSARHGDSALRTAGAAVSLTGVVMLAVGIPLLVIGGKKVPATASASSLTFTF